MSKDSQPGELAPSPPSLVSSIASWIASSLPLSPFGSSNPAQQPVQEVCGVLDADSQPALPEPPSAPPSPTTPPSSPDMLASPAPQSPKNSELQIKVLNYWSSFFTDRIKVLISRMEECGDLLSDVTEAIVSLTASSISATPQRRQDIAMHMFEATKHKSYLATKKPELQNQIKNLKERLGEIVRLEAEPKDWEAKLAVIIQGFMGAGLPPAESEPASSWGAVADSAIAGVKAAGIVGASFAAGAVAVGTLGVEIVVSEAVFVGWTLTSNLVIYGTLRLVTNGGAAAVPVALVTWTGTGALVLKKLTGSTASPEELEA